MEFNQSKKYRDMHTTLINVLKYRCTGGYGSVVLYYLTAVITNKV